MLTVLLTILIAVNTAQSSESSTAELLEKGIYTEETVGDLRLAIEIYAQVVEQVSGERLHAGRALYRMGLCYQKIGDAKQAESTFQKLIADYPDQTDLVSLARQHLPDEQAGTVLEPAPWKDGEEAFSTTRDSDFPSKYTLLYQTPCRTVSLSSVVSGFVSTGI